MNHKEVKKLVQSQTSSTEQSWNINHGLAPETRYLWPLHCVAMKAENRTLTQLPAFAHHQVSGVNQLRANLISPIPPPTPSCPLPIPLKASPITLCICKYSCVQL